MVIPTIGAVVVVNYPFTDLSNSKLRPAVVLADADRGDVVLCQITSNRYADTRAVEITPASFTSGGLRVTGYVRPTKLFTGNDALITKQPGTLSDRALTEIIEALSLCLTTLYQHHEQLTCQQTRRDFRCR